MDGQLSAVSRGSGAGLSSSTTSTTSKPSPLLDGGVYQSESGCRRGHLSRTGDDDDDDGRSLGLGEGLDPGVGGRLQLAEEPRRVAELCLSGIAGTLEACSVIVGAFFFSWMGGRGEGNGIIQLLSLLVVRLVWGKATEEDDQNMVMEGRLE